jgi:hypothetical protein
MKQKTKELMTYLKNLGYEAYEEQQKDIIIQNRNGNYITAKDFAKYGYVFVGIHSTGYIRIEPINGESK